MYCKNCGSQLDDNADVCLKCGVYTDKGKAMMSANNKKTNEDVSTNALDIVSFLIPLAGVILGIVYMATGRPKAGQRYLIIGIVTWIAVYILLMIFGNM